MTGKVCGGKMIIELDINFEKLEAPAGEDGGRRYWLPCSDCGKVRSMPWNTVSFICWDHDHERQGARRYLVICVECGERTSRDYAEKHCGVCKPCFTGTPRVKS